MHTAVIGAGFAGLAAGAKLADAGRSVEIFEARPVWGGHTHSTNDDGFIFDEGPHVSFTKDEDVRRVFLAGADEVEEIKARITNAYKGKWLTHPAQCHLHGLDPELITRCIIDFVAAQKDPPTIETYADWCVAMFGRTFAETFTFAYTRKYWTIEAAAMSTDWVGSRLYPPKLEDVIRGAVTPEAPGEFHYLQGFRYPRRGGYQAFMNAMVRPDRLRLNKQVAEIDLEARTLRFTDGTVQGFDRLISTMPLDAFVRAVRPDQVPAAVREAADRLLCTSVALVDVAVRRADLSDHHWFYVYDEDISFARGHFPHMLSPCNAPPGCGSIQLEVYYSKHRDLPCSVAELGDPGSCAVAMSCCGAACVQWSTPTWSSICTVARPWRSSCRG